MADGWTNRGVFLRGQEFGIAPGTLPASYFVALVQGKDEKNLNAGPAVDKTGGKVGIPVTAHGFGDRAQITIKGTTNYAKSYLVDTDSTTNEVVIVAWDPTIVGESFDAETFVSDGTQTMHEAPGPITDTMADLVETPAVNGYTSGGIEVLRSGTGFLAVVEDDVAHFAGIPLQSVMWTASGGDLGPARYAVLRDNNGTIPSSIVLAYFDLGAARTVSDTQSITLPDLELRSLTR